MSQSSGVVIQLSKHPNADRLSVARIMGTDWQCVTETAQWTGLFCNAVYVEIDSLVDVSTPEFAFLASKARHKLSDGRPAARIKTARIRGVLSQGLVVPVPDRVVSGCTTVSTILPDGSELPHPFHGEWDQVLGVERYEPPVPAELRGDVVRCPGLFEPYTKIENAKNWPCLFAEGETVVVHEKLHGTNARVGLVDDGLLGEDGRPQLTYCVGSHATARDPAGSNIYSTHARWYLPEATLRTVARDIGVQRQLIFYGEIYGHKVQDLTYGLFARATSFALFDVLVDGSFMSHAAVRSMAARLGVQTPPVVFAGLFRQKLVPEWRDGNSMVPGATHVREGVVVRCAKETLATPEGPNDFTGRKMLKYVSDAYLERRGARDGH